jgi:uncharacterized protein YqjF (DUF2071 family)
VSDAIEQDAPPLTGRIVAGQDWRSVAFLHWRVPAEQVVPLLPPGVVPDEHDGSSWVGLIGFLLDRATLGPLPPIPVWGTFAEINVRLYARDATGRRGVVFLSLEASRLAAVLAARAAFSIPYFWSRTSLDTAGDTVRYHATRHWGPGVSTFALKPGAAISEPSDLENFLTARWGLFTRRAGRTIFLPNTHERWPLQSATVTELHDSLVSIAGIEVVGPPESVLFSPGVAARFAGGMQVPRE